MNQIDLFSYPNSPGYRNTDTSLQAAATVKDHIAIRNLVLQCLVDYGPQTFYEVAERMGMEICRIQPRISDLKALGKATDSGQRGKTPYGKQAIKWMKA